MDGLDRDDLMSLTIILLVSMLKKKKTDISQLIAELTGKGERTVRLWRPGLNFSPTKNHFLTVFRENTRGLVYCGTRKK